MIRFLGLGLYLNEQFLDSKLLICYVCWWGLNMGLKYLSISWVREREGLDSELVHKCAKNELSLFFNIYI